MNSALAYLLLPFVAAVCMVWWKRRQTDLASMRRRVRVATAGCVVALALAAVAMGGFAHMLGGRVKGLEVLGTWCFLVSLGLIYAGLRWLVFRVVGWMCRRAPGVEVPRWAGGVGVGVTLLLFAPYLFTAVNVHRPKIGNAVTPESLGLPFEAQTVRTRDGVRLATWFIPAPDVAHGTVLLCHGIGSSRGDLLPVAKWLHHEGYHVTLLDFRGHGDSAGHVTSFGYYEALDVVAAVRHLQERADVDASRLVGYAFSMGSAALLLSLRDGNPFRAVVLDSPFARLSDLQAHRLSPVGPMRLGVSPMVHFWSWVELGVTPAEIAPVEWVGRLSPTPLLVIHGEDDRTIPVGQARKLFAAAGEPKSLWTVPGAKHVGAMSVATDEYRRRVSAFLQRAVATEPNAGR